VPFVCGCSLQTSAPGACQTNRQCASAFGLGSACSADGLCAEPQPHARCADSSPADLLGDPAKYQDAIVFGTLFDFSSAAERGRQSAVQLAVTQINAQGGIDGRSLGLVLCDIEPGKGDTAASTREGAVAAAQYLTHSLEVPALLGPSFSSDVAAVYQQVRGSSSVVISPSATSPALSGMDSTNPSDDQPGLLWRTVPPDSLQGQTIARDLVGRGITQASVIAQTGAYGEGLSSEFARAYPYQFDLHVFSNAGQLSEATTSVATGPAQEVLFIASAEDDVVSFLTAVASNPDYATKTLFLTDGAATEEILERAPRALFRKIRGTRPHQLDTRDPVNGTFVAGYAAEYGVDATQLSFTAQAYDMTWVTALGAAWSLLQTGEVSGVGIAKGARHLSAGEEVSLIPSYWSTALQYFRTGQGINIRGASGDLDYDPQTEETSGAIDIWYIDTNASPPRFAVVLP
jgi:ABC-type branched-subunit amino acid transport system substrate-binding protein